MALFTALRDNFDDNTTNTSLWDTYTVRNGTVTESNSYVEVNIPIHTGSGNDYAGYISKVGYDLTGSRVLVEVPAAVEGNFGDTYLAVYTAGNNDYIYIIEASSGALSFTAKTPTLFDSSDVTYNATTHRWWSIRESGGTIYFETSSDGITWTVRKTASAMFASTNLVAEIAGGTYGPANKGGYAAFDNFNYVTTYRTITSGGTGSSGATLVSETATLSIVSGGSGGGSATVLTEYQAIAQKGYDYRVFTHAGAYIGTWKNVSSKFSYNQSLNQTPSELVVTIPRSPNNRDVLIDSLLDTSSAVITDSAGDNILLSSTTENSVGTGTDIDYNYNVDVYTYYGSWDNLLDHNGNVITDENNTAIVVMVGYPDGRRVYSGYIANYELVYGDNAGVNVTIVPHSTELQHFVYKSGSNTTVVHNSTDPVVMAKSAMDSYIAQGGVMTYDTTSMILSGWTSSYTFQLQRIREVIDKSVQLLPAGYYWFPDPGENKVYLKQKGVTADHTFYYEKHINNLKLKRSITQLVNEVYFVGGETGAGPLFKRYTDASSISTYRHGLDILTDSRVTTSTSADILSQSKIDEFKTPRYQTSVRITDAVYDIEDIKLGQMVGFKNFGNSVDNLILQIVALHREEHAVTLDLDMVTPGDAKRLEEIKRNIEAIEVEGIAVAPS